MVPFQRFRYLDAVLTMIEDNLNEEIDLEELAKTGFVSLMQLYRDFYTYTGHSVKEYIRKRRLSNACAMLKYSNAPLAEIALANGYGTQQSFHKHFKAVLGMTPSAYRCGDVHFFFYHFDHGDISLPVRVETITIPMAVSCKFYSPRLRGIEFRAITDLRGTMAKDYRLNGEKLRLFGRNTKQRGNRFGYELLIATPPGKTDTWLDALGKGAFDEAAVNEATTSTFASCIVKPNEEAILGGWDFLYNTWLKCSMFVMDERGYFEEYLFRGGKLAGLKLYLPVKKEPIYQTLTLEEAPAMIFLVSRKTGPRAEETAAKCVMGFLRDRYPGLAGEATTFYVSDDGDTYECGVKLDREISTKGAGDIELIRYPAGTYAVINDRCSGEADIHRRRLRLWLERQGFAREGQKIFALFKTNGWDFTVENISMTVYAPVNLLRTDNTKRM